MRSCAASSTNVTSHKVAIGVRRSQPPSVFANRKAPNQKLRRLRWHPHQHAFGAPDKDTMDDLTDLEKKALAASKFYQDWDSGYSKQQSTRPQTVGYGLVDSPAGLAAWILEKYHRWMDCDGHPENVVSRDALLDNIMFYWLTSAGASSARLYWESFGTAAGTDHDTKRLFNVSQRNIPRL